MERQLFASNSVTTGQTECRDVTEAIVDQLLPEGMNQNDTKNVVHYIKDIHNQEKILIILDGLDELPKTAESYVDKLPHKRILPFCHVLASSRQEEGIVKRHNVEFDVLLQIKGFTESNSYNYIRKYFRHLVKIMNQRENDLFRQFRKIPIYMNSQAIH